MPKPVTDRQNYQILEAEDVLKISWLSCWTFYHLWKLATGCSCYTVWNSDGVGVGVGVNVSISYSS